MTKRPEASGGIGIAGAVFIVFLVLKLTGSIYWSWWWVTCPLWALPAICIAFVAVVAVLAFVVQVAKEVTK